MQFPAAMAMHINEYVFCPTTAVMTDGGTQWYIMLNSGHVFVAPWFTS
jgi:hypothetical protein